jgi:hypothetical protein
MCALPWPDDSLDVVTSLNGSGTSRRRWRRSIACSDLAAGSRCPSGEIPKRLDLWKAWVPAIIELSPPGELESSGDLLRFSEPGEAERLLRDAGFEPGRRGSTLAQAEFVDAELAARAFCSTGPSWAAANHSGEDVLRSRIAALMRPFESPRTGIVRLVNEWAWITARREPRRCRSGSTNAVRKSTRAPAAEVDERPESRSVIHRDALLRVARNTCVP